MPNSQPSLTAVHVDRPLTNISIAFLQGNEDFVADKVFPTVQSKSKSDQFFRFEKGNFFRTEAKERAPGTESAGTGFELSTSTFTTVLNGIHKDIPDQIRANADSPLDLDRATTELITRQLWLRREKDWADAFFTTSVWDTDFTPATLWSAAGSTPIEDIRTKSVDIMRATGFMPNKLVLGMDTWAILQDHPDFLDRVKFVERAILAPDLLASVLGLDEVLISGAVENNAAEGATDALDFINASKSALLVHAASSPSLMTPSGGYTFSWSEFDTGPISMFKFRMDQLRSDRIEAESAYVHELISGELGVFFDSAVA